MKYLSLIAFLLCLICSNLTGRGQGISLSDDPSGFVADIDTLFNRTQKESIIATASEFSVAWPNIGSNLKEKIIKQSQTLMDRNMRIVPHLSGYIKTIANAVNIEGIDNNKLTQYLNMTETVVGEYNEKMLFGYFKTMTSFFAHHALYYSSGNKLYVFNDDYSMEYATYEEKPAIEVNTQTEDGYYEEEEEEPEDEIVYDDAYWEALEAQTAALTNPSAEATTFNDVPTGPTMVKPTVELPEKYGPVINFKKADLNFAAYYDSTFLLNTSGFYLIENHTFTGSGGKFDWRSTGLDESVYVDIKDYTFKTDKPFIRAMDVVMHYDKILQAPIEGIFEFKSTRHDSVTAPIYPRFISYKSDAKYQLYSDDRLKITGGLNLIGTKITTKNFAKDKSKIQSSGNPGNYFIARGTEFILADSAITSNETSLSIIHKRDSIFHPAIKFYYETGRRKLRVYPHEGQYSKSPYLSSYLNMNFITENIVWSLEADSLDLFIRQSKNWQPMVFESIEHFDIADYQSMSGVYNFHPIGILAAYARKSGTKVFAVSDVSSSMKVNYENLEAAVIHLDYLGLLYFDKRTGYVTLTDKAMLLNEANFKMSDYDDIIFESQITDNINEPNATLFLNEEKMVVRGVEYFELSDSLNVQIEPDSGRLVLYKNRGIEFNGKISAGNFEFNGKDFLFKYDSFLINLGIIDSVKFYTEDEFGNRSAIDNSMVGLDSAAAAVAGIDNSENQTSGTLYINDPNNKSALTSMPNYPNFNAGMGGVIFFDRKEIFNGVYDKSIFFVVPPFDIDSLSGSDPSAIQFEGVFSSGGMFPNFEEKLKHQPDNSLGFNHQVPDNGYQLFEGSGMLYGDLKLNKGGIQSNGKVDFLATALLSENFVFYPDSVTGRGFQAEIREEEHNGVIFPQAILSNYKMQWIPKKDSMYVSNTGDPFQFYNNSATLDGTAIISNSGVYGLGKLATRGSESISEQLTFNHDGFSARHAEFKVSSSDPEKPALAGNDVRLNFNLNENFADIAPEIEGSAAINFPYAQFKTSIPSGRWQLDEQKIYMKKPNDVPLEKSYFYTTNKDLDSLNFNGSNAVYDINTLELKVSGIPFITVADAKITPENNEVLIHENSRIGTLYNTIIILDTLNAYHRLYAGVINIISRNEFSGFATYELVNAVNDTFAIEMTDFRLEDFSDLNGGRNAGTIQHTVADGTVAEEDNILMSPGMYFKGKVKLLAHTPMLQLDGYLKLNLKNIPNYDTWIQYNHDADQEKISIDFDNSLTEDGKKLSAGLYFNSLDNSLYSIFAEDPQNQGDDPFFRPSGQLFYDEEKSEYVIEDTLKSSGKNFSGKVFTYNENSGDIKFEGPVNFFNATNDAEIKAAILGSGNLETTDFNLNSFITLDFNVPKTIWDLMALEINEVIENLGAPDGMGDPTDLLYKIAEIMGEKNTKAYEERTLKEYVPLAGFAVEVSKPLTFADINLKWSAEQQAFYSEGLLGLSNILGYNLNGAFEGFLEIKKNEDTTPVLNLFLKASADSWYYFGYEDNRLLIYTNNKNINTVISEKTNSAKANAGEMVFIPGSAAEVLEYVNRYRFEYYQIDEPYKLNAEAVLDVIEKEEEKIDPSVKKEEKKKEVVEDDGF